MRELHPALARLPAALGSAIAAPAPTPPAPVEAPGLTHEAFWWGRIYRGTASALIDSGLADPAWMPGAPGQHKTGGRGERDGVRVRTTKTSATRYQLFFHYPKAIADAECARLTERRRVAAEAARVAAWEQETALDAEGYRARLASTVAGVRAFIEDYAKSHESGRSLAPAALEEISEAFDEIAAVIAQAPVCFDRAGREARVRARRAEVASADTGLQRALASSLALPQEADHV